MITSEELKVWREGYYNTEPDNYRCEYASNRFIQLLDEVERMREEAAMMANMILFAAYISAVKLNPEDCPSTLAIAKKYTNVEKFQKEGRDG